MIHRILKSSAVKTEDTYTRECEKICLFDTNLEQQNCNWLLSPIDTNAFVSSIWKYAECWWWFRNKSLFLHYNAINCHFSIEEQSLEHNRITIRLLLMIVWQIHHEHMSLWLFIRIGGGSWTANQYINNGFIDMLQKFDECLWFHRI